VIFAKIAITPAPARAPARQSKRGRTSRTRRKGTIWLSPAAGTNPDLFVIPEHLALPFGGNLG